ncbi:hypothetical protein PaG_01835 [Moesziomyces aphidis]|uniref:CRA domain-containing protein n=1 Tax=Moesziomyces aphidis TaxID=84754 RepID=W3VPX2_MOEAP|nr:hypothetical protein PaG_01835 [Moesziomyces aphidis]
MQPPKPDPTRTQPAASPSASSDDVDLTSPANLRKLVLNYLLHHCYTDTAVAFAKDGIIGDLYASDLPARPAAASTSQASDSSSRVDTSTGSPPEPAFRSTSATATTATNGAAARQAHPLSAPPLSRDDSSMEIEVENLLPTTSEHPAAHTDHTNGHSNGASRPDQSRAQDELADAELASDIDDAEDDLDVDISPDLTADDLRGVRARKQIKDYIIAGHIRQAMDMINTHFPTVLNSTAPTASTATSTAASNGSKSSRSKAAGTTSTTTTTTATGCEKVLPANPTSMEPDHLLLNLQIQVFIEAIRSASTSQLASATNGAASAASPQMGPAGAFPSLASTTPGIAAAAISRAASPAPSTSSSNGSATSATGTSAALNPALHSALAYAQGLYTSAQKLPSFWRAMYLKELEQVTALLAYTDVEHSPVRRFLHRSRKVALAEQVNSAILLRGGKSSQPLIEVAVRQTTLLANHLHAEEVHVPSAHPVLALVSPAGTAYDDSSTKKHSSTKKMPPWKFRSFLHER